MKSLILASAAASALLLAGCAEEAPVDEPEDMAAAPAMEADPMAAEPMGGTAWDTNSDGMFQQAEYTGWADQGVAGWDTDADSQLSAEEFNAGWGEAGFANPDGIFEAWDDDADGFLTDEEFFDDEEWTEWDADTSGALEAEEFEFY